MIPRMVALEPDEIARADNLAQRRMAASDGLNREKYKKKGLPQIMYDRCAAYGEFAVAKWLDLPEPDGVNTWHGPDVGDRVQVRSIGITEPGGPPPQAKRLIVRPNDNPSDVFVLVFVDMDGASNERVQCDLLGFIEGSAARVQIWWREDAWWVPRMSLRDCAVLDEALGLF